MGGKIIIIILLMFLNYIGISKLMLISGKFQTLLLIILFILSIIAIKKMFRNEGYKLAAFIFAIQFIDAIVILYSKGLTLRLTGLLFINISGFIIALVSTGKEEEMETPPKPVKPVEKVETYTTEAPVEKTAEVVVEAPKEEKPKKKPKKKKTKKKPKKKSKKK